ncbi:MAG: hypothetical protein PUP92_28840, partial [Rhizonema sp. PD38]|nr:hypothetical protein [Rhizonema sp. PD38]
LVGMAFKPPAKRAMSSSFDGSGTQCRANAACCGHQRSAWFSGTCYQSCFREGRLSRSSGIVSN